MNTAYEIKTEEEKNMQCDTETWTRPKKKGDRRSERDGFVKNWRAQ